MHTNICVWLNVENTSLLKGHYIIIITNRLRFLESGLYNCFPGGGRGLNEYSYFSGDGRKADSNEVGEFLIGWKTEFEGDIGIGEDGVDEIFSLSVEELKLMEELI